MTLRRYNKEGMSMEDYDLQSIKSRDNYDIPIALHPPQDDAKPAGNVVLVHGIFSNKDEDGRFIRQAQLLSSNGFRVWRFDFRGHGNHPVRPRDLSISGMLIDLKSVLKYVSENHSQPISIVASSFGASITLLYLQTQDAISIKKLVLLNPVVEYKLTFLHPLKQQMRELFTSEKWLELKATGYICPLPDFCIPESLIIEMQLVRPFRTFDKLDIPTRVVHGSEDTAVSYELAMAYSLRSPNVDFQIIKGADHAFVEKKYESESFALILDWLKGE